MTRTKDAKSFFQIFSSFSQPRETRRIRFSAATRISIFRLDGFEFQKAGDKDEKVELLVALCKAARPIWGKKIDVPAHHLPDGVKTYQFDAGSFWRCIQLNFVSSEKPGTKLTKDQIDLLRRELPWIEAEIASLVAQRAKRG